MMGWLVREGLEREEGRTGPVYIVGWRWERLVGVPEERGGVREVTRWDVRGEDV